MSEPPNFGEVKGSCLTSVKIWLYEDELLAKLLRAPFYVPSKVCHDVHLHSAVSWPKSNHLPSISSHLGVLTERDTLSTMCIIKGGVNFVPNQVILRDFEDNSIIQRV